MVGFEDILAARRLDNVAGTFEASATFLCILNSVNAVLWPILWPKSKRVLSLTRKSYVNRSHDWYLCVSNKLAVYICELNDFILSVDCIHQLDFVKIRVNVGVYNSIPCTLNGTYYTNQQVIIVIFYWSSEQIIF